MGIIIDENLNFKYIYNELLILEPYKHYHLEILKITEMIDLHLYTETIKFMKLEDKKTSNNGE